MATTALQNLPIPVESDTPDVPRDITALANAVEKRLAAVYDNVSDRDARNASPQEGQLAILRDVNQVWCYFDTAWTQIFPATGLPAITSGTTVPNNANGVDGDLYLQV